MAAFQLKHITNGAKEPGLKMGNGKGAAGRKGVEVLRLICPSASNAALLQSSDLLTLLHWCSKGDLVC